MWKGVLNINVYRAYDDEFSAHVRWPAIKSKAATTMTARRQWWYSRWAEEEKLDRFPPLLTLLIAKLWGRPKQPLLLHCLCWWPPRRTVDVSNIGGQSTARSSQSEGKKHPPPPLLGGYYLYLPSTHDPPTTTTLRSGRTTDATATHSNCPTKKAKSHLPITGKKAAPPFQE